MKETRKSDSGASVLSPGSTRKQERNRHMSEPTKKATETQSRLSSTNSQTQPASPSPASKVSTATTTIDTSTSSSGSQKSQLGNLAKLDLNQPAMTTDQETGMRKFVEQATPSEPSPISPQLQQQHDLSKAKKPAKISVVMSSDTSGSLPSTPTDGRTSGSSSASSSSAPTPVPQRKGRGVKKSGGGKSQKPPTSASQTTSKPASSHANATATEAVRTPATVVPPPPLGETVQDQLERKESDGSLGSTDSESTSSSNSEKSEKDDTNISSKPEIEPDPPLAKDQGTGQTIPLLLAQEEFLLSKCKPSPDDESPTLPTDVGGDGVERDGGGEGQQQQEREPEKKDKLPLLPTPRAVGRSKKKLRQQQKREDKLRRKERERERHRDNKEEEDKKKEQLQSPDRERPHSLAQSLSLEDREEHITEQTTTKTKKMVVTSPKKAKRLELKTTKPEKSPGRSRTAPAKVALPPRPSTPPPSSASSPSPPAPKTTRSLSKEDEEDSDESPEPDQLSHTWGGRELDDMMKDSPEPSSPHSQPESLKTYSRENSEEGADCHSDGTNLSSSSSHPMEAIPISALRAMRAKGAKQTKLEEEGVPHPLPVAGKKSGVSRKPKDAEKLPPRMARAMTSSPAVPAQSDSKPSPQKKKSIPKIIADDDISIEGTLAMEPTIGEQPPGRSKSSHMPPTSPHEIATTLLKKRKGKGEGGGRGNGGIGGNSDTHDQEGSDDADEGKLQTLDEEDEEEEEGENLLGKVLWAGDSEPSPHKRQMRHVHYKAAPTTLSLDAEPFYPSSDYPRGKQARSRPHPHPHHHVDTPYPPPGSGGRQLNSSPSAFTSPEEIARSFERNYRVREIPPPQHLSLHAQHLRHHGNTLTPSPPLPVHSEHPPSSLYYHEGRHDSGDFPPRRSRAPPPDMSYEISPEEYYSSVPTPTRRVSEGLPPSSQRSSRMMRSTMYEEQPYPGSLHPHTHHHHSQHAAAYEALHQHRRERSQLMPRSSPNPLWDQPSPYPYTPQEEAQILRMRQQQRLAKLLAWQRSIEALSSPLGHPLSPHPRPPRSTLYPADTPTSNLWDPTYLDPEAYAHQSDDAFLNDFHQLRHRQQDQHVVSQVPPLQPRRRRYSSDNELGGELVPDLLQTPSSPSHVSSSGLNKAPGTAFSGMVGARRSVTTAREQELWPHSPEVQILSQNLLPTSSICVRFRTHTQFSSACYYICD